MGNSQSAQLHTNGVIVDSSFKKELSRINRYASPEHKVLPGPIPGQKLKNTDNGNILSNGGTISGKKFGRFSSFEDSDPEVLAILNRRSALINGKDSEELQNSKRYHSDPDLTNHTLGNVNPRTDSSCPSKARINRARRKKSKAQAPAPPPVNMSTLPIDLDKIPKYRRNNDYRRTSDSKYMEQENNKRNISRTKSPAPKPPDDVYKDANANGGRNLLVTSIVPVPPPPPPDSFKKTTCTRYSTERESKLNNFNKFSDRKQQMENKGNLNVRKQRHSKISSDNRFNQSLHDDIKAAVQKRLSSSDENEKRTGKMAPLKQYYFAGGKPEANMKSKKNDKTKQEEKKSVPKPPQQYYFGANISAVNEMTGKVQSKQKERENRKNVKGVVTKAIVERTFSTSENATAETKRFEYSPNEKRRSNREDFVEQKDKKVHSWYDIEAPNNISNPKSGNSQRLRSLSVSSSECDPDIRMNLRPMVPAKRSENPPKFSPTQAWRSLSIDDIIRDGSNERSSDDTDFDESQVVTLNRANALTSRSVDKSKNSGLYSDANNPDPAHDDQCRPVGWEENAYPKSSNNRSTSGKAKKSIVENSRVGNKPQWTPEQDLSDDCCDSPTFRNTSPEQNVNPVVVNVQPKLVTPAAFSSMPYLNYTQYPSQEDGSLNEGVGMSPSEKVKEKTKRGGRRRSKSNKSTKNDNSQPSSLQIFKNSMISALSINKKNNYHGKMDSTNWSLSRSIPNSLNELELDAKSSNTRGREPVRRSNKPSYMSSLQDHPELLLFDDNNYRSLPQLNRLEKAGIRKGHVVYLPEYKTVQIPCWNRKQRSKSKDSKREQGLNNSSDFPKPQYEDRRRLWFMSTMEKEMQEKNNEKQPDWMNRVEEEFKSKRDREKANIRQQLRILNLENKRSDMSIDDPAMNSSDSQDIDSPTFEYRRYRSRSEDGLSKSPNFNENRVQTRSRSFHELREDPSGHFSVPLMFPPPQNSLPPLDLFFGKKKFQDSLSTLSPASSSHASYTEQDFNHSKGFSKWFRKKPKDEDIKHPLNTSVRPDPEGCRSSSEENKELNENIAVCQKNSHGQDLTKRQSIYKQLNEIAEREEKLKEHNKVSANDQNSFSRLNSSRRMNSAGESFSESDVELRNSCENLSRPRSRHYVASKDSLTSSEDGHAESGFYSSSDHKKPSEDISNRYLEYNGNYEQKKIPLGYAQPFTPSRGYRPVAFNPTIKPFVK